MSDNDPFDGEGFSREPLSQDELAVMRSMRFKLARRFDTIEGLDDLVKGGWRLTRIVAVMGILGGLTAWLARSGMLGL